MRKTKQRDNEIVCCENFELSDDGEEVSGEEVTWSPERSVLCLVEIFRLFEAGNRLIVIFAFKEKSKRKKKKRNRKENE
jgi:hypothetical protein